MTTLFIVPAYGRSYNSTEDLLNAWKEGKDFKIPEGPYCSIRDIGLMKENDITEIHFLTYSTKITL